MDADFKSIQNHSDCIQWGKSPGADYQGKEYHSIFGEECVQWSKLDNDNVTFPDNSILESMNYCRNPNGSPYGPWCWINTDNETYEQTCKQIPVCNMPTYIHQIYLSQMEEFNEPIIIQTELCKMEHTFVLISFPIFLVIGTIFNMLSIAVFRRPVLRKFTLPLLLLILAISDTILLYFHVVEK